MLNSRSWPLLFFVFACGGKVEPGLGDAAPTNDASPPPTPTVDASPPPADCTDLDLVGQPTSIQQIPGDPPPFAATGGAISVGIYQLTSIQIFTGPGGASGVDGSVDARIRVTVAQNALNVETVAQMEQEAEQRTAATATTSAPGELDITTYCPSAAPVESAEYSFDGTVLSIFVGGTEEQFTLVTK